MWRPPEVGGAAEGDLRPFADEGTDNGWVFGDTSADPRLVWAPPAAQFGEEFADADADSDDTRGVMEALFSEAPPLARGVAPEVEITGGDGGDWGVCWLLPSPLTAASATESPKSSPAPAARAEPKPLPAFRFAAHDIRSPLVPRRVRFPSREPAVSDEDGVLARDSSVEAAEGAEVNGTGVETDGASATSAEGAGCDTTEAPTVSPSSSSSSAAETDFRFGTVFEEGTIGRRMLLSFLFPADTAGATALLVSSPLLLSSPSTTLGCFDILWCLFSYSLSGCVLIE